MKSDSTKYQQDNFLKDGDEVFIFDIDGTLAHMVDRGPFEWAKVGSDEVDKVI